MKVWMEEVPGNAFGEEVRYFKFEYEFEKVVAKKYLVWDEDADAFTDNGNLPRWEAFTEAYELMADVIKAYASDLAMALVSVQPLDFDAS